MLTDVDVDDNGGAYFMLLTIHPVCISFCIHGTFFPAKALNMMIRVYVSRRLRKSPF